MAAPALVLATRNVGKLRELRELFASAHIAVVGLDELGLVEDAAAEAGIESHATFEENAIAKARHFSALLPGRIVIADDSGLEVDALGGAPGVHSKRWAGGDGDSVDGANNAKLVAEVAGRSNRAARYVCVVGCRDAKGGELVVRGECRGYIVDEPSGSSGFGYDPHFFVTELARTLADATPLEKARVGHRGRAFRRLLAMLEGGH